MAERVIRRRKVTTRDRNGCVTCRARRLKCDEGKPECSNCSRLGIRCGGYVQPIVFKDQTELFKQKHSKAQRKRACGEAGSERLGAERRVNPHPISSPTQSPPSIQQSPSALIAAGASGKSNPADHQSSACQDTQRRIEYEAATSLASISGSTAVERVISSYENNPASPSISDAGGSATPDTAQRRRCRCCPSSDAGRCFFDQSATFQLEGNHEGDTSWVTTGRRGIKPAPIVPLGLLESTKFAEDMVYYHHLRDRPPFGLLSILSLTDIIDADYLGGSFFHAALALSALEISQSHAPKMLRSKAALHSLDHFVTALGTVGQIQVDSEDSEISNPETPVGPYKQEKAISWLSTVLFLAQFELQRGQMRLWYVHSRAAVNFLCEHLSLVLESDIGESLIRCFARIAALLDIYDRTHSVQTCLPSSEVSNSLMQSLRTSPFPHDRLLFILPRVNQLEEQWRANPRLDVHWEGQIEGLRLELEGWRNSLDPCEIPLFDDRDLEAERLEFEVQPFTIHQAREPARAATNFMHYLVSLLRLEIMRSPGPGRNFTAPEFAAVVCRICRLAAGIPYALCAAVNAYGHGMLPALMNAYCLSEDAKAKDWMINWIAHFPRDREGIWNVRRMQRLLAYLDEEYSHRGPRSGWSVIKVRMVDLEEEGSTPLPSDGSETDRFYVEIYAKGSRGWSIDFVEID